MNGALVSTVIRSLALTIGGGDLSQSSALWCDSWTRYSPTQRKEGQEDGETSKEKQIGLKYKESLEAHGMILLPSSLLTWDTWPIFTPKVMKDLAVYQNGFQKSFKHMPDMQKKLKQENRLFATFCSYLTRAKQYPRGSVSFDWNSKYAIYLGAELIVQEFIKDIFSLFASRFECGVKDESVWKTIFLESLDKDEANGLVELDFGMVETLLRSQPNVSLVKAAARHMNSHFMQYISGFWYDKLMGLFLWDDNPIVSNDNKKQGWENMPFRRLARSLYLFGRREYNDATARQFLVTSRTVASQKI